MDSNSATANSTNIQENMKFCKHCGAKIPAAAVICTHCGCQVEEMKQNEQPSIVINNANTNSNINNNVNAAVLGVRAKNKWVAFWLCFFLGGFGERVDVAKGLGEKLCGFFTDVADAECIDETVEPCRF